MPPISGASCRQLGTASERSNARKGSCPRGATHLPRARVRPASGLEMRGRLGPKRLALRCRAHVSGSGCQSHGRRPRDGRQNGSLTQVTPRGSVESSRGLARIHPTLAPFGVSGRVLDPSIESVQPTCQRSAPGFRVGCRLGFNRGRRVLRITSLHPLRPAERRAAPAFSSGAAC